MIVQQLWANHRDNPQLLAKVQQAWTAWKDDLKYLPKVTLRRCYSHFYMDHPDVHWEIHTFSDASEKTYEAVAYLHSEGPRGIIPCLTSSLIEGDSTKAIVHTNFQDLWCFDRSTVDKIASNWPHSEVGQSHLMWLHNCPPLAPFWVLPLVVTAALFTSAVYLARITILKKRLFPLFKCLITCAVHFEVLTFDAFPMAQSRFVSQCGWLFCSFRQLCDDLQQLLTRQQSTYR